MKCYICGSKMERLKTNKIALEAIKRLGIEFNGTWRCPNRMKHNFIKKR